MSLQLISELHSAFNLEDSDALRHGIHCACEAVDAEVLALMAGWIRRGLSRAFGIAVVAVAVETALQDSPLIELGCA